MIVLLRRKTIWGITLIGLGCVLMVISFIGPKPAVRTLAAVGVEKPHPILIWDAGHGGADGGAVSAGGVPESGINLAIARDCYDLCLFFGQNAAMTRTTDASLADESALSLRRQKVSDTKNRVSMINGFDDAVLISIHQNSLPSAKSTHGAMVFYNDVPPAALLGSSIQNALNQAVNSKNEKQCREISKQIYIMAHADCPAVLVECGFMSNAAEAVQLQSAAYQAKLACTILCGYLQCKG